MGNFDIDLAFGEGFEKQVHDMLKTDDNGKVSIEVKTERAKWQETGNLAIEISYYGKKSGLMATEASTWCHVLADGNEIVFSINFPVDKLRIVINEMIKNDEVNVVMGGDDNASEIVLIPINSLYKMSVYMLHGSQ